ncbi:MAG: sugar ABC transporter substrate-binding protein [Anaerolineaceae bacterium]|nr:sugar ABC transporter substrate-binding protein [Anaerolineaceae bacterium]
MKKLLMIVGLLMILSLVVSCAPKPAQETPAPIQPTSKAGTTTEVASPKEPVTLTFMRPGLGDDAMVETEAQMGPFYEMYPWITVETIILPPPDVSTKLQTGIAGGAPPDIVMGLGIFDAIKYSDSGQFLDMTPFAEAEGFDWKNYYDPASLAYFGVNGRLECVPETSDTRTLAYNKDMFDAAGLAYPTDDWTWDDLLTAAQALTLDTNGDGQINQWGFATHTWDYQPWIWAAGGALFNDDYSEILVTDPVVESTFQFLTDLRYKYEVWPPEEVTSTFPEVGFMFAQNQLAMYPARWLPDTIFFFADLPFNWDVVMMPKNPETGLRAASKGGGCIGAFAATEHPEETYLLWKYLTSDEGVYNRSVGSNGIPALAGGPEATWPLLTEAFTKVDQPANAIAFVEMQPFTRFHEIPLANAGEIYSAINPFLDELWLGLKTIDELAPQIKEAVDPLLKK